MPISLGQPTIGSTSWGATVNGNFATIEAAINGLQTGGFLAGYLSVTNNSSTPGKYTGFQFGSWGLLGSSTDRLTGNAGAGGQYLIDYSVFVVSGSYSSGIWKERIYKNGAEILNLDTYIKLMDLECLHYTGIITLLAGDYLELYGTNGATTVVNTQRKFFLTRVSS